MEKKTKKVAEGRREEGRGGEGEREREGGEEGEEKEAHDLATDSTNESK